MTGRPDEFTWSWDVSRGCRVIRRHGAHYLDIPNDYSTTYVFRVVDMLNKER